MPVIYPVKLQTKLKIDHYLGGCLAWILNMAARLVARLWRRDHTLVQSPRAVLLLKFTGLGSITRSAFLLNAIRERWPQCRIAYACFPSCEGLLRRYPMIDEVIVVRDRGLISLGLDTIRLILRSWRLRVDLVIDLEVHSKYSSVVTSLTMARDRAGFAGVTSRFRRGLYTHLVFWNPIRRVDLAYRQLGRALSLDPRPTYVAPALDAVARGMVDELLSKLEIPRRAKLLGINPNASDLRVERRWPAEKFAEVIGAIPSESGVHVLLLGSPAERAYTDSVARLARAPHPPIHNVAGSLSFAGYVALLERLDLLLTNDSGPLHIAAALGTSTVSLWGPSHPRVYSPRGPNHVVFYRPVFCSPCIHTADVPPCGGNNVCLSEQDSAPVARAVCSMLGCTVTLLPRSESHENVKAAERPIFGYWIRDSVQRPNRVVKNS